MAVLDWTAHVAFTAGSHYTHAVCYVFKFPIASIREYNSALLLPFSLHSYVIAMHGDNSRWPCYSPGLLVAIWQKSRRLLQPLFGPLRAAPAASGKGFVYRSAMPGLLLVEHSHALLLHCRSAYSILSRLQYAIKSCECNTCCVYDHPC